MGHPPALMNSEWNWRSGIIPLRLRSSVSECAEGWASRRTRSAPQIRSPTGHSGTLRVYTCCRRTSGLANSIPIISAHGLSKKFGVAPLFKNISFTVSEGDRIGLIGPNGSGKSTLLEILYGRVKPDSGDVAIRKGTRLSCVTQVSEFARERYRPLRDRKRPGAGSGPARRSPVAHRGNAGPRGLHGFRSAHRDLVRRLEQTPGDCRGPRAAAGHPAAR